MVTQGEVEIRKGDRVLARLHAGQTVGEMALLEVAPRSADAVATEATRVVRFDRAAFGAFLETHPACGVRFFFETGREMSRRLRSTSEYLMTVFEVGRIVAAGHAVAGPGRPDPGSAPARPGGGRVRPPAPAAPAGRRRRDRRARGEHGPRGRPLRGVAERHVAEPGFHDVVGGRAILGATLCGEGGEVMGALLLEKDGDEKPFTVEEEIVLEAVAHQAEQGILAAWAREEQAARERLERHRQQGY